MAVCFENMLKNSLSGGNILNAYFIFGNDAYLKRQYVDKIIDAVVDRNDVFNYSFFTDSADMQEVYDTVEQFPMMSEKKCVVLADYDFERASKNDFEKLIEILSNVPDTSVFIVWCNNFEFDIKKSNKTKKIINAVEKSGGMAAQIDHRTVAELKKMLEKGALKRGTSFELGAAQYLIETCSEDINVLISELEKLCAYANGDKITKQMVDAVCVKSLDASVYSLSKEIFALNVTGAMNLIDELIFMRTEPTIILHSIFSVLIDAYRVYLGQNAGINIPTVAKDFGYGSREFVLTRLPSNIKRLDNRQFDLCFNAVIEADAALKRFGAEQRTVLEELIIRLIYILQKGEDIDTLK